MFRSRPPTGVFLRASLAHLSVRFGLGMSSAAALAGPLAACSGADAERLEFSADAPEGDRGMDTALDRGIGRADDVTPFAHVDVRVTERIDGANSEVLAHFVYSSERVYANSVTSLNRPDRVLPMPGRCVVLGEAQRPRTEPSALLHAGAVTLRAVPLVAATTLGIESEEVVEADAEAAGPNRVDGSRVEALGAPVEFTLAPRAFPGASTLSPGVVYTSRDRQPLLPTAGTYEVDVQGGTDVPPMKLRASAPGALSSVTLAGTPIRQVTDLVWGQPVDITWDVATPSANSAEPDLVYVDVATKEGGQGLVRCAYNDSAGSGTLPWTSTLEQGVLQQQGLTGTAKVTLALHRLRRVTSSSPSGVAQGELRFDFELTRDVNFVTVVPNL